MAFLEAECAKLRSENHRLRAIIGRRRVRDTALAPTNGTVSTTADAPVRYDSPTAEKATRRRQRSSPRKLDGPRSTPCCRSSWAAKWLQCRDTGRSIPARQLALSATNAHSRNSKTRLLIVWAQSETGRWQSSTIRMPCQSRAGGSSLETCPRGRCEQPAFLALRASIGNLSLCAQQLPPLFRCRGTQSALRSRPS